MCHNEVSLHAQFNTVQQVAGIIIAGISQVLFLFACLIYTICATSHPLSDGSITTIWLG